jgi:alpha-mannosidase
VDGSHAECAFAVVDRGLVAEGGPHERALATFVSRRFDDCSPPDDAAGVALLHDGLLEYEVVGDGTEIALTLLRATGYLSRSEPAYRPNPAGPLHELDGPQLQGPLALDYALLPHRGGWRTAEVAAAADDFLVPLETAWVDPSPRPDPAARPPIGAVLSVSGAQVSAVVRDAAGALTIRLVNLSPTPTDALVSVAGVRARGDVVNLVGEAQHRFDGPVPMRPWEIVTLRLRP